MSADGLAPVMLLGATVVLIAVLAVQLSTRAGLPILLAYIGLGIALGGAGLGVDLPDRQVAQVLGLSALVIILAEGGLTTRWSAVRSAMGLAAVLATAGVAASVAVVAVVAHFVLGLDWRLALLAGAVLSSTDAAAVFATLRRLPLRRRLGAVLEAESGLNDAPSVLLVVLLSGPEWAAAPLWQTAALLVYELFAGAAIGAAIGAAGAWGLRRSALPAAGLYPLAAIALTVLSYGAAVVAHSSGFLAVYVTALVLGNSRLPHRRATLGFADGLAWTAQIGLFVLLGLLVVPSRLSAVVLPALVVGGCLVLVARPVSVVISVWLRRVLGRAVAWVFGRRRGHTPGRREQVFLSWAGLRGAVPIVLALIPLTAGVPGSEWLFDVVFVLVVIFTGIQGTTLPWVGRRLGVTDPGATHDLEVDSAPLDGLCADLIQLSVPPRSRLSGVYVDELRLPTGSAVSLVVRAGAAFVPNGDTRLRSGDALLVVATADSRRAVERRLQEVGRRGKLARWFSDVS